MPCPHSAPNYHRSCLHLNPDHRLWGFTMIHPNPLRGISTGFSRISNPPIHSLPRRLFLTAAITMLALAAGAQTSKAPEAATPSAGFQGLGQMPGGWPAAGTYTSGISGDGSTIMGYGWVCKNGRSEEHTSELQSPIHLVC